MTRAEERMVLLGAWPESPAEGSAGPDQAGSYLDLLASRFEGVGSMTDLWHAAESSGGRLDRHGARWVFPALLPAEASAAGPSEAEAGSEAAERANRPTPEEVIAEAERLRSLRRAAAARSARKVSAPASQEAHRRLEELLDARFEEGGGAEGGGDEAARRGAAMAAGSAVHRVLEDLDLARLSDDPAGELARHRERLDEFLRPYFHGTSTETGASASIGEASAEARRRVEEVLDRLGADTGEGGVLARLAALRDHVVSRELPVLLPAESESSEAAGDGPVGFVSGALDLLYRDPESGDLVVADYKTDRVEVEGDLSALTDLVGAYAPQARLYARAVREALDLPEPPRAELWFLWAGRVVAVDQR
jgi:ATP-dependent exoDNAse (exonuclease V) beta subunit